MDLILIPLQPNQPPARHSHTNNRQRRAKYHPKHRVPPASTRDRHAETSRGEENLRDREPEVQGPGMVLQMTTEDGEEAEDLNAEEGEAEDMLGCGETGGEDCAGH